MLEPMLIQENVPLAPLTTFGIGGAARYFVAAQSEADIVTSLDWAQARSLPVFILGGGSNLLVQDDGFAGLVLQIGILGISSSNDGMVHAGAGEPWGSFVDYAIAHQLAGVECLTGIPGLVGGTPVQNVGAYGQEVSETIAQVRAFDHSAKAWVTLSNTECRFRYRESLFNTDEPNRYIVTLVSFRLRPDGAPCLRYSDLQKRFAPGATPSLAEVATTVRAVRREKGMLLVPGDPDCRSAGSFFKNPIVPTTALQHIGDALKVPTTDIPNWPAGVGTVKLPAAWLLERAGFVKGYSAGPAAISSRHTLALINKGGASCADILRLQDTIIAEVAARFGITLQREPVLLG